MLLKSSCRMCLFHQSPLLPAGELDLRWRCTTANISLLLRLLLTALQQTRASSWGRPRLLNSRIHLRLTWLNCVLFLLCYKKAYKNLKVLAPLWLGVLSWFGTFRECSPPFPIDLLLRGLSQKLYLSWTEIQYFQCWDKCLRFWVVNIQYSRCN